MDTKRESRLVLGRDAQAQMSRSFGQFGREPRKGLTRTVLAIEWFVFPRSEGMEWRAVVLL